MTSCTLIVPASSSNLGPGFDALGLALTLYNELDVHDSDRWSLSIEGEGASILPHDEQNLLLRVAHEVAQLLGRPMRPARLICRNAIALDRGLGSSSTAVVLGILLANVRTNGSLTREQMLEIATRYEGHPDNVAPAIFGGLQVSVLSEGRVHHVDFAPAVKAMPSVVVYVPEFRMPTKEARAVLPQTVSLQDAVFNLSRVGLLLAALAADRRELLREATGDRLHQRQRSSIFSALTSLIERGYQAGAIAVWLSGAGSTVAAFAANADEAHAIGEAFCSAGAEAGLSGRSLVLSVDTRGAIVQELYADAT
jgi:homoserine kinase